MIGKVDKMDLPSLGLFDLECKIDTGAYTSTIHCSKVKVVIENGVKQLNFWVLDRLHPQFNDMVHTATDFSVKRVRSSNGVLEERYAVKTEAVLFGKRYPITFTLSDRKKMRFPVLLGRKFINRKFLVDVSKDDLSFQLKINDSID